MKSRPVRLVSLLSLISFVGYPVRNSITVTAKLMMPALGISQVQMGNVFSSFQLFYALFQAPAGLIGDRYGARKVLGIALIIWALASLATGVVPASGGVGLVLLLLYFARAALGIGHAATYPVGGMVIYRHVPAQYRARSNGIFIAAAAAGSALAPPIVAWGMVTFGWRSIFYVSTLISLLLAYVWWRAAPDPQPRTAEFPRASEHLRRSLRLLRDRDLLLASLSYLCTGALWFLFVYWFYIYLTDVRGFTVLKGGVFAAMPYLAGAVIGPMGGFITDALTPTRGAVFARRSIVVLGIIGAALCVLIGVRLSNPYLGIATLSMSYALLNFIEGPVWATAGELGGDHAGLACGVLNSFGNIGGVFSAFAVPRMVELWGWTTSIGAFGGLALFAAALWMFIHPVRRASSSP